MAFKPANLVKIPVGLTSANLTDPTGGAYIYTSADVASAVAAAGYFNTRRNVLKVGDIIFCDCNGVMRHKKVAAVPADGVSNVTTTDMATAGNNSIVFGTGVTVAAVDTVATGLGSVTACGATLNSDPLDNPEWITADYGNQAGAPPAGSIRIKTWQNTSGTDPTPVAASVFGKTYSWWAAGPPA